MNRARPDPGNIAGNAGALTVNVTGNLTITNQGVITGSTFTSGAGGYVIVNAGSIELGTDGEIVASTFSTGDAGNVTVNAGSIDINGSDEAATGTGIFDGTSLVPGNAGNAGDIGVTVAGALTIESGGEILASTLSTGQGGNVAVQAGSLKINGVNAPIDPSTELPARTGIINESGEPKYLNSHGNAGNLMVNVTGDLEITNQGVITGSTFTSGAGGYVIVNAGSIELGTDGEIVASTFSTGDAGNVTVNAGSIDINGSDEAATGTGIFDGTSLVPGNAGNAGDIGVVLPQTE